MQPDSRTQPVVHGKILPGERPDPVAESLTQPPTNLKKTANFTPKSGYIAGLASAGLAAKAIEYSKASFGYFLLFFPWSSLPSLSLSSVSHTPVLTLMASGWKA